MSVSASSCRTQKACGVMALAESSTHSHKGWMTPAVAVIQDPSEIEYRAWRFLTYSGNGEAFARPCPKKPRHGFIDSVKVTSVEAIAQLWNKMVQIEPEGELLLMQLIDASSNAIWKPGMVAIGPGNDGATSGTNSIAFPVISKIPKYLEKTCVKARIDLAKEAPFVEVVYDQNTSMWATQIRSGPKTEGFSDNFITEDTLVTKVIHAEGDLLEWETTMLNQPKGTVVHHPGGSMASHYGVHAMLNNIPVCITFKPKVGQVIKKETNVEDYDVNAMVAGIGAGMAVKLKSDSERKTAAHAALTGLHNAAAMRGKHTFYIGVAAAVLWRLGLAACLGEYRHKHSKSKSRDEVYDRALSRGTRMRKAFLRAARSFYVGHWSEGYGGRAWAACASAVGKLDNAVQQFVTDPNNETLKTVIMDMNLVINQAHNNGWWMNKFVDTATFDRAADGDPKVWLKAAPLLYRANQIANPIAKGYAKFWTVTDKLDMRLARRGIKLPPIVTRAYVRWRKGGGDMYYGWCMAFSKDRGNKNAIESRRMMDLATIPKNVGEELDDILTSGSATYLTQEEKNKYFSSYDTDNKDAAWMAVEINDATLDVPWSTLHTPGGKLLGNLFNLR